MLCQKITEHECYTELVETIIKAVTDVSQAKNPSTKTQENVDTINGVVRFIREKHIKPSWKLLSDKTIFTDFITAAGDKATMNLARSMVETKILVNEFVKDWKEQHNTKVRFRNKVKQREYMEKRWGGHLLPSSREQKDPNTSSVIKHLILTSWRHQHVKNNNKSPTTNSTYQK